MNERTNLRPVRSRADNAECNVSAHRDRWLISYADLMTLLFSLFVLLYAAADHERARAVAEVLGGQISGTQVATGAKSPGGTGVLPGGNSIVEARVAIERTLASNETLRARARVTTTERGLVVSLAEAGFFAPGEAVVREDARALIDTLAETLRGTQSLIRVEGHTDSVPIATARYPSNWELSSARASMVLAQLVAHGIAPARLAVAGYASEQPVADNSTPEGRALNRRVDLVILQTGK
jgi:chemotaxis protein MotB